MLKLNKKPTPSCQPPSGMTPMTHTVEQQRLKDARSPVMMLPVATTRIGHAKPIPISIP